MQAGGVAAMEVVSRDHEALGLYQARTLSYDGGRWTRLAGTVTRRCRARGISSPPKLAFRRGLSYFKGLERPTSSYLSSIGGRGQDVPRHVWRCLTVDFKCFPITSTGQRPKEKRRYMIDLAALLVAGARNHRDRHLIEIPV